MALAGALLATARMHPHPPGLARVSLRDGLIEGGPETLEALLEARLAPGMLNGVATEMAAHLAAPEAERVISRWIALATQPGGAHWDIGAAENRALLSALASRHTADGARAAVRAALEAIDHDEMRHSALMAAICEALATALSPAQADDLQSGLLERAQKGTGDQHAALLTALVALSKAGTPAFAEKRFQQLQEVLAGTNQHDRMIALGLALGELALLDRRRITTGFFGVTRAVATIELDEGPWPDEGPAADLLALMQKLARQMPPAQAAEKRAALRSLLAWSANEQRSEHLAKAAIEVLKQEPTHVYVGEIASMLKYPSAAAKATAVLLDALKGRVRQAPGSAAGLEANLDWMASAYPSASVPGPPDCPRPYRGGVACPALP